MHKISENKSQRNKGGALFLILIAVALFAALSYAVALQGRGQGNIDQENMELALSQFLQHSAAVRYAVQRLILTGRCTEYTIRFWHADRTSAADPDYYGDGSNPSCQVFDPQGGGVGYIERNATLSNGAFGTNQIEVRSQIMYGTGSDSSSFGPDGGWLGADLFMLLNVSRDVCLLINDRMGIVNPSGEPPDMNALGDASGQDYSVPVGRQETFPTTATGGYVITGAQPGRYGRASEIQGFKTGCFQNLDSGSSTVYYALYDIILAR